MESHCLASGARRLPSAPGRTKSICGTSRRWVRSPSANLMSSQSFFCDISSSSPPPPQPRPRFRLPPLSVRNSLPGGEAVNHLQRDDGAGERRGCGRLPVVLTPTEHHATRGGRRRAGGEAGQRGRAGRRRAEEGKGDASEAAPAGQVGRQHQPQQLSGTLNNL